MEPSREEAVAALIDAAATAPGLADYRVRVLAALARVVRFDAALVHALSPRVPLATAVVQGIDLSRVASTLPDWDTLGEVLSPLRERANRVLVASDDEALPPRSAARRKLEGLVLKPFGQRSLCMMHLVVRGRVVAAVVLLARRPHAFEAGAVETLRSLAPLVAAGDLLHQRLDDVPEAASPVRLVCSDQRLTARQRAVVEHVALGYTNAEIGAALGVTVHAVRNHLARAFVAVGASNRADVVRRAVLHPASP